MNIFAHSLSPVIFLSSKILKGHVNAAGVRGQRTSIGRGGACLCCSPALGGAQNGDSHTCRQDASDRAKNTGVRNSGEAWNLPVRAEIMAPVKKFQIPNNVKSKFSAVSGFLFWMIQTTAKRFILKCSKNWPTAHFHVLISIISAFPPAIHLTVTKCRVEDSP